MPRIPAADPREAFSKRVTVSKSDGSQETIFRSSNFCGSDADITIISSDGVRFQLHKKNLALSTGGFPPLEFARTSAGREEVILSESGYTLDLLFRFVYPQRYPDLEGIVIGVLSELADAAEKYEVYAAILGCKMAMKLEVSSHPVDVFAYATRYDYLDLADRVAPLILGTSLNVLASCLSAAALAGWVRYLASWDAIRSQWTALILDSITAVSAHRDIRGERWYKTICCQEGCRSRAFLTELAKHMVTKTKLLDLAAAVACSHCKSSYADKLIRDAPAQYSQFEKFRTFLHQEGTA